MGINKRYLAAFFIFLTIEIIIALFIRDNIIRPYVGDILVVILLYTFIKSFIRKPIKFLPLYIFIFSVMVEILQYLNIVEILNIQGNKVLSTIVGATFDIKDIFCYLVGCIILIIWEVHFIDKTCFGD
ncbi:ribosomal maturation YjgA family protein [Acetivibrio saccincola]|mgnify:FL=1|jgi:hypothetical protein|uniref:DUF2809 domain-containing protein n=1 Tax=Acetivibrio saccincola TaxID=1677857 RepID=A0A2K9ELV6_9FIRM|nr:DUF2809 domain-containing protein [Acetivibrio saccincola]AUG57571.1 hypothetical protein HVS_08315 [Acetivibrio saccincola]NLW26862.1 DUF2809 domain-containing protein [Acetivibrio saccincola]HOA96471.1 DUF2809 domain-containing protein [Acetivibrio saccincola]HQD28753.1 DUF2809 domain-containing protein [Acetivibrio saccincola]